MLAVPMNIFMKLVYQWVEDINERLAIDCYKNLCIGMDKCEMFEKYLSPVSFDLNGTLFEMGPRGYLINATDLDPSEEDF